MITAILLAHFVERQDNLPRIIDDLTGGTVAPDEIIVFIDDPAIRCTDSRVTEIRSDRPFLPIVRFGLGAVVTSEYCFFMDDDMTVQKDTLARFAHFTQEYPAAVLGAEGSILGNTPTPYSNDTPVRGVTDGKPVPVDIVIRSYFVPTRCIPAGLELRSRYPIFPKTSLDDVYLCLGNKFVNKNQNYVIPLAPAETFINLGEAGVGQSFDGNHYKNRNYVCRKLMDIYL